jgi:hypothetical protein
MQRKCVSEPDRELGETKCIREKVQSRLRPVAMVLSEKMSLMNHRSIPLGGQSFFTQGTEVFGRNR